MPLIITANFQAANGVEINQVEHEGKTYYIVPVVALVPGVLNNSYVSAEEVSRFVESWNGIPLPLGHPQERGVPVSAQTPVIVAELSVGRFWNASFEDNRLKGEMWIDIEKCERLGGDALAVLERLRNNEVIEVSTSYFCDVREEAGQFNGRPYQTVTHNIRPNHLAILLHERGACNVDDGCGFPRTNAEDYSDDAMIAFYPSLEGRVQLAALMNDILPDGAEALTPDDLHLTLAYLGLTADIALTETEMAEVLYQVANAMPTVKGRVDGTGLFYNTHKKDETGQRYLAVVGLFNSPSLASWRNSLVNFLAHHGVTCPTDNGFTPHLTYAYLPPGTAFNAVPHEPIPLEFTQVTLAWGNSISVFNLNDGGATPVSYNGQLPPEPEKEAASPETQSSTPNAPSNPSTVKETPTVNREEMIQAIAEATNADPTELQALSDAALQALLNSLQTDVEAAPASPEAAPAEAPATSGGTAVELGELAQLLAQFGGVSGLKEALNVNKNLAEEVEKLGGFKTLSKIVANQKAQEEAQRTRLISALTSNGAFTAEELTDLSTPILEKMVAGLPGAVPSHFARNQFLGNAEADEDPGFMDLPDPRQEGGLLANKGRKIRQNGR